MSISLLNRTYVKKILYIWNKKKTQRLNDTIQAIEKKTYFKEKINTILKRALPNEFLAKITKYD